MVLIPGASLTTRSRPCAGLWPAILRLTRQESTHSPGPRRRHSRLGKLQSSRHGCTGDPHEEYYPMDRSQSRPETFGQATGAGLRKSFNLDAHSHDLIQDFITKSHAQFTE